MPLNAAQLAAGANYQLMSYAKSDPVDQVNTARPFLKDLIASKVESAFSNGVFNEKVYYRNQSNYQNYTGDDQVTYNRRDPSRLAPFQHYEAHDGFGLNETELANNGIRIVTDSDAMPTEDEKSQIVSLLKVHHTALKEGFQEKMNFEYLRDGTQDAKAVPGVDALIAIDPTTGTVGGIDRSVAANSYWRNNFDIGITVSSAGDLIDAWEIQWRACMTYGGEQPDRIYVGSDMLDAFRRDARAVQDINVSAKSSGGVALDPATGELRFHGVRVQWDPSFDALQTLTSAAESWAKRAYFINSKHLKLRPNKGRWMVKRKPSSMYDRYVHYWGLTNDVGLTMDKANCHAVLTLD
jgi:hypothetical protein